jgi:hypothetical protein
MRTISLNQLCKWFPAVSREAWREWRKAATAATRQRERRKVLEMAGELLGLNVKSIFNQSLSDPCGLDYLNTGDTYGNTLRLHDSGTIDAGTWGDWVESMERRGVHFD